MVRYDLRLNTIIIQRWLSCHFFQNASGFNDLKKEVSSWWTVNAVGRPPSPPPPLPPLPPPHTNYTELIALKIAVEWLSELNK